MTENDSKASLLAAGIAIGINLLMAFIAGSDGMETPGWYWIGLIAIAVYGMARGVVAVSKRSHVGLLGIVVNLLLVFWFVFGIGWNSTWS